MNHNLLAALNVFSALFKAETLSFSQRYHYELTATRRFNLSLLYVLKAGASESFSSQISATNMQLNECLSFCKYILTT